jgi:hypothetical protein
MSPGVNRFFATGWSLPPASHRESLHMLHSRLWSVVCAAVVLCATCAPVAAQDQVAPEDDYYKLIRLPIPEGIVLEVGGLEQLPDGRLAVATRRGEIYFVDVARSRG